MLIKRWRSAFHEWIQSEIFCFLSLVQNINLHFKGILFITRVRCRETGVASVWLTFGFLFIYSNSQRERERILHRPHHLPPLIRRPIYGCTITS
jgi:hypothetical protein